MRKFKIGLITLAASTALLMPTAGNATVTTQSPSSASSSASECVLSCNDWYEDDVLVAINMDAAATAIWCGVTVQELAAMSVGDVFSCPNPRKKVKRSR